MSDLFNASQTSDALNGGASNKKWAYIIIAVVFVVIVAVIYYFRPRAEDAIVNGPFVLLGDDGKPRKETIKNIFETKDVQSSLGNNFTFSFFVYMDDVNRERIPFGAPEGDYRFKPLVYILGVGDFLVDPLHQKGRLRVRPLTEKGLFDSSNMEVHTINNFMISRWNQVTFTIEGRSVDVYLNGAPVISGLLENLPILFPVGVLLETSPDFSGQAALFQAWPRRLTQAEVVANYKKNTDTRGKPLIPDIGPWGAFNVGWKNFLDGLCSVGFCGFRFKTGPMQYVDYDFA
jgi:hypothetical protein